MNLRTRLGVTIATAALGAFGLLGMAACGSPSAGQDHSQSMSPEATALTALGFSDSDVTGDSTTGASVTTAPSAGPNNRHRNNPRLRRLLIRRALAGHVEHGQVTVETKDGDKTILVQRGVITALTSTGMTVKSSDGFTMTWTFDSSMRVLENRSTIQSSGVKPGEMVGVAGLLNGSENDAKLVVIPNQNR